MYYYTGSEEFCQEIF